MLDAHSALSEEELEAIMHDDELRDIHEMSSAIMGAYVWQPEIDADEEWSIFRKKIRRKPSPMRGVMRIAAVLLGVVFVSGILVKWVDRLCVPEKYPLIAKVETTKPCKDVKSTAEEIPDSIIDRNSSPSQPTSKSVELPTKGRMAKAKVNKPKEIEMPTEGDVDVDEFLRIQQARIDNELALQTAELIRYEYVALRQMYDISGEHNKVMECAIRKVTIQ